MGGKGSGGKRKGSGRPEGATAPESKVVAVRLYLRTINAIEASREEKIGDWLKMVCLEEEGIIVYESKKKGQSSKTEKIKKASPPKEKKPQCDPLEPVCNVRIDGGVCSVYAALFVPSQKGAQGIEKIPARYCLLEIEDLITSHNPLTGFGPRQGYPKEAQERDYKLVNEQYKVTEIAQHYAPELIFSTAPGALDGVPVATQDRIVLGGNGRTMATEIVYQTSNAPKLYLEAHAREFGFTKAQVKQLKRPMVVRTIQVKDESPKVLAQWSRRLNASLSQQLDATRLAVSRARFVDARVFDELAKMEPDETLNEFLSTQKSKGFVLALQHSNVLDARSSAQYLTSEGLLSQQGRELASDLLVATLVPDADLILALGVGRVGTLARSAPYIVQSSNLGEWSLTFRIKAAIKDRVSMLRGGFPTVAAFLKQGGLFSEFKAETLDDVVALLLLKIFVALEFSPVQFAKVMRSYLASARAPGGGQSSLFASETLTPLTALQKALRDNKVEIVGAKLPTKPAKKAKSVVKKSK